MHRHNTLAKLYLLPSIENGLKAMTERRLLCEVIKTVSECSRSSLSFSGPSPWNGCGIATRLYS